MLYHQDTPVSDSAPHEHEECSPFESATYERRQDPVDEQCSSRAKMWNPVKDCNDPSTTQVDISGFSPVPHNRSRLDHSKAHASPSIGFHPPHSNHLHGKARETQQQSWDMAPTGVGLPHFDQPHDIGLGYRGSASMDLFPFPRPQAIASAYQVNASMNPQPIQMGNPHDQLQHYHQQRPLYGDISTLHPPLTDPSRHIGSQSVMEGTALMGMQPHQAAKLHDHAQENGQQIIGMESRMPTTMASHELVQSRGSPLSILANISAPKTSGSQRANPHQRESFFPDISQATHMARYARTLDQQSNREEAIHAYERACALFQDAIITSSSFEERMECNTARKACQARLDVLLRESAASPFNSPLGQNDQQDDDGAGGGKPQYSLHEDWALCRKMQEGLSWQEVAETSIFKGRRKHRSLSQRKHTIGKMGPKYHEAEEPWSEAENRKLCALGDAGKSLGDIHRKFRSRNAERCLDRYFYLKGYNDPGSSHTHTPQQARHAPASRPYSPESKQDPGGVARHRVYGVHPGTSISETGSHGQSIDSALQQTHQRPNTFSQNVPSVFTRRSQTSEASYPSSPSASPQFLGGSTASQFSNDAASPRPPVIRHQGPSGPQRRFRRQGVSFSTPSYSSALSSSRNPEHRTAFMPPPSCYPSAPGALNDDVSRRTASFEAHTNASAELPLASWHPRLSLSSSSLSATTANSPANQMSPTSSLSTPKTLTSPLASRNSPDLHGVAAKKVHKPG